MENILIAELRKFHSSDYFILNEIPAKKLDAAYSNYNLDSNEKVLALIDATVFGSAKNGMAICLSGLYWNNDWTVKSRMNSLTWEALIDCADDMITDGSNLVLSPVCIFDLTGSKVKAEQLRNLLLSLSNCLIEAIQEHSKSKPEQIQKAKNNLEHAMIRFKTIFRVLDNEKIRPVAEIAVNHFDELKEQLDYGINAGEIFEEANLIYQLSDNFIEAMHEREEINLDLATPNDQDSELVHCLKALLLYLGDHREQQNFDHKVNGFMKNR